MPGPDRAMRKVKVKGGSMLGNDWEIKQRLKIQSANTVNLLIQHFHGKIVLEPGQIHVGLSLLKKVLPDVSFVEIKGSVTHSVIRAPTLASDAETWTIEHVPPEHKLIETEPE